MKMTTKYLTTVSIIMVCSLCAGAQTLLSIDFSATAGYTDGGFLAEQPSKGTAWTDAGTSADSMYIEKGTLAVIGTGAGGKWNYITFPVIKTPIIFTFEGVYVGDGTRANVGVCLSDTDNFNLDSNAAPTYNEQGAIIRFANDSLIDVRNGDGVGGGAYEKLEDILYNDLVKFYIRALVDPAAGEVTIFVRKEGEKSETKIAENYGFRRNVSTTTKGLNCLAIFENSSDGSIADVGFYFDNFVITAQPTDVQEWALF